MLKSLNWLGVQLRWVIGKEHVPVDIRASRSLHCLRSSQSTWTTGSAERCCCRLAVGGLRAARSSHSRMSAVARYTWSRRGPRSLARGLGPLLKNHPVRAREHPTQTSLTIHTLTCESIVRTGGNSAVSINS